MGAIGFDTMCAEVKLRMSNRSDLEPYNVTTNPGGNAAGINWYQLWVNQAYKHVCGARNLFGVSQKVIIPELETVADVATVSQTATIALPTSYSIIRHVVDVDNNYRLHMIPESQYITYTDRSSFYGRPTEWCRMGPYIYLHMTPDAVYNLQVFYRYIPSDLSGDSTTVIGDAWDEAIMTLATYKGMMKMRELDQAQVVKAELIGLLNDIIPAAHEEEKDRAQWMRPDFAHISYFGE